MKAVVYACMADGLEEVECLAAADVMIRCGITVKLVSMTGNREVTGTHGIRIMTDLLWEESEPDEADCIFLPGGMPGTKNLAAHKELGEALVRAVDEGRRVAAICAAPSVLGGLGMLEGKKATCYPGFEEALTGAEYTHQGVVTDGLVTTARGLGYALDLGLELSRLLVGKDTAAKVKAGIQYDQV